MLRLHPGLVGLVLLGSLTVSSVAGARQFRVDDLPNGTKYDCRNCHMDDGGSLMSPMGSDARLYLVYGPGIGTQEAHIAWLPQLCTLDSDRDGYTNGQELGDPDCVWEGGAPAGSAVSNPGDPDSFPPPVCGNGKLDAGEPCEGTEQRETDCQAEFAGEGVLGCTDQCRYDYSGCTAPPISAGSTGSGTEGDGLVEEGSGCSATGGVGTHGAVALALGALGLVAATRRRAATRAR